MNQAELDAIVKTIITLGSQGKEAFIWWLVFDKVLPILQHLLMFGLAAYVIIRVARMIHSSSEDTMFVHQTAQIVLGPGFTEVYASTRNRCLAELRRKFGG